MLTIEIYYRFRIWRIDREIARGYSGALDEMLAKGQQVVDLPEDEGPLDS